MNDTVFIYGLNDPTTGRCRYIGRAVNPTRRFKRHLHDAPMRVTHKDNWICSLTSEGLLPALEVIDEVPKTEWEFWEREYIRVFRLIGMNLTNLTGGGDGMLGVAPWNKGKTHTPEHRYGSGNATRGKKRTPETKQKMSLAKLGKIVSVETRQRMSLSAKVKVFSAEHRRKLSESMKQRMALPEAKEKMRRLSLSRKGPNGRFLKKEKI